MTSQSSPPLSFVQTELSYPEDAEHVYKYVNNISVKAQCSKTLDKCRDVIPCNTPFF